MSTTPTPNSPDATSTPSTTVPVPAPAEPIVPASVPVPPVEKVVVPAEPMPASPMVVHYYTELARISAGLFVGVLATMTFLLTVGYSRPHDVFAWSLYASIGILGLSLVSYVFGHMSRGGKGLHMIHLIQQVLFVLGVIAVVVMALSAANFFFTLPSQAGPTQ